MVKGSNALKIYVAHGSRATEWVKLFEDFLVEIHNASTMPENHIMTYMELNHPSLDETLLSVKEKGVREVEVIPLFLAAGRHLKRDIPEIISAHQDKTFQVKLLTSMLEDKRLVSRLAQHYAS